MYSFVKWLQPRIQIISNVILSPQTPCTCSGVDRSRNIHSLTYRHPDGIVKKQFSREIFYRILVWNTRRLSARTAFYRGMHNGYLFHKYSHHELSGYLEDTRINVQRIHKKMVRFQKLTRNLFLTLHGYILYRQQRRLSKFLIRYQQFASHAYCGAAGPVSKFPLQRTCYTESGMNLITMWLCVVWPRVHILKDCD